MDKIESILVGFAVIGTIRNTIYISRLERNLKETVRVVKAMLERDDDAAL